MLPSRDELKIKRLSLRIRGLNSACSVLIASRFRASFPDGSFPVKLVLGFGAYRISKDPQLSIPEGTQVKIEDLLTGVVFDLTTSESFSFKVNRTIAERFVIHIDRPRSK